MRRIPNIKLLLWRRRPAGDFRTIREMKKQPARRRRHENLRLRQIRLIRSINRGSSEKYISRAQIIWTSCGRA